MGRSLRRMNRLWNTKGRLLTDDDEQIEEFGKANDRVVCDIVHR